MTMQAVGTIAAKIIDRWAWWSKALADPSKIGSPEIPVHDGEAHQGYYRVRPKDGAWEPVAIFYPEGSDKIVAYRNGQEVDSAGIWTWCCRNPISVEAYDKAIAGGGFDDEPARSPGVGHNSGEADPFDALKIEYLGEKEQVTEFLKKPVKTQADADKMAIWKDRLTKIKSKAAALHKVEKQPWLDGGREVDAKWRDLKEEPDTIVEKMRLHVKPFFDEQKRIEEERQRKAREEADALRKQAEEAAAKARIVDEDQDAVQREANRLAAEEAAAKARQAEKDAEARKVSAGRTGARMGLRTEKVGVVTDYEKAAIALVRMKHADMLAMIDTLAKRAGKAKMVFDGMEIRDEEVVR